eukprot:TRINITY_DN1657_c0_g4_i2.p1 TRINITY_DN1657_c0_g4~~TRINITY_DN1657_c0_g4_i2.p1  ORF type:complete len:554 (-),score=113.15 TRINITY_DN1657_c0_g4_i2:163-1824(-)
MNYNTPVKVWQVYTVTVDTFLATLLDVGDYRFESIGVSRTGDLYVYSNAMGMGKYLLNQKTIVWFGRNSGAQESYDLEYAGLTTYNSALHNKDYFLKIPSISFDNDGKVYLLDLSNFRVYDVPAAYVPPPIVTFSFSSLPDENGFYLSTEEGFLNMTIVYNVPEFSSSKLVLSDNQTNVVFYENPVENTQIHVPLAKANHTVTWQICLILSINNNEQSFCGPTFGVNNVPKVFHRVFHINPLYYLSRTRTFSLPINETDGDAVSISSISIQHGTISSYNGISFTYVAPKYFNGTDRLDYTVCDEFDGCVTSWTNINVFYIAPNCALNDTWRIPKSQVETHWTLSKLNCNTTVHDKYHFFANPVSNDNKATFAVTGSAGHNSTIVMTLIPNHSGVVSWSFTLASLGSETYPYTFSLHVPNNLPTFLAPYTQTWNHLTASNIPYMNILDNCIDEDGDTCVLNSLLPGKGATPSTVKQLDPLTIVYTTLNVILQGSADGTIQILTAERNGANYTPGAPVNVKTFKGSISFQFSAGDGDLDQTGNLFVWSTATITAN